MNGRDGGRLVMEMDSGVLCASSSYFAGMVLRSRLKVADVVKDCWEIEVDGVENLEGFRGMIEMMYDRDEMSWLMKEGVERAIDVLEVRILFLLCMCMCEVLRLFFVMFYEVGGLGLSGIENVKVESSIFSTCSKLVSLPNMYI